jgi:hypothetical protein
MAVILQGKHPPVPGETGLPLVVRCSWLSWPTRELRRAGWVKPSDSRGQGRTARRASSTATDEQAGYPERAPTAVKVVREVHGGYDEKTHPSLGGET